MSTFRLPEHAVRAAFAIDERPICDGTRIFSDMMGAGSVRLLGEEPLTAWEHISQAGMVMALLQRHLSHDQQAVLVARHLRPVTTHSERLKRVCLEITLNRARPELPKIPLNFMVDAARGWAGLQREHKDMWWMDKLDVDIRTMRHWRRGRRYNGHRLWGILSLLDSLEQDCYDSLFEPMILAGLVEDTKR